MAVGDIDLWEVIVEVLVNEGVSVYAKLAIILGARLTETIEDFTTEVHDSKCIP